MDDNDMPGTAVVLAALVQAGIILGIVRLRVWYRRFRKEQPDQANRDDGYGW